MAKTYYLPMTEGLGWEGREVFRNHNGVFSFWDGKYRFADTCDVCHVYKSTNPRKGDLFLRPTGTRNRWRVERATCDFQKKIYLIVGHRTD